MACVRLETQLASLCQHISNSDWSFAVGCRNLQAFHLDNNIENNSNVQVCQPSNAKYL